MYGKTNVATFLVLSSNNSVTVLLNALTKSSKVSLQGLLPRVLQGQLIRDRHFQIHLKARKYKDQRGFFD